MDKIGYDGRQLGRIWKDIAEAEEDHAKHELLDISETHLNDQTNYYLKLIDAGYTMTQVIMVVNVKEISGCNAKKEFSTRFR